MISLFDGNFCKLFSAPITVKDPERVRYWHENVQLSINHNSSSLARRAVIIAERCATFLYAKIVHVQEIEHFFAYSSLVGRLHCKNHSVIHQFLLLSLRKVLIWHFFPFP